MTTARKRKRQIKIERRGHSYIVFLSIHIPDAENEQAAFEETQAGHGVILSAKVVEQEQQVMQ